MRVSDCAVTNHHDPVKLLRATVHSKKAIKKKETASVAVSCCKIAIELRPSRLGRLKKLAFLQECDDRVAPFYFLGQGLSMETIMARGWPSSLAPNSGRIKSRLSSAQGEWAKCIVPAILGSTARWPSRFWRHPLRTIPSDCGVSSRKRALWQR